MATRDAKDPNIQFDHLGGLDERPAPNALDAPNFTQCHALYQRNAGALQRLEGSRTLAVRTHIVNNVQLPLGVLGMDQLDDGTGNLIVQNEDGSEYLYTLDELFGRTVTSNLIYLPLQDDNNMPTATIIHDTANGTAAGSIGVVDVWADRELTSNPINESSIIVTFTSGAAGSFVLAPGTYRIRGYVSVYGKMVPTGASTDTNATIGYQCALVNTTDSATTVVGTPDKLEFDRIGTTQYTAGKTLVSWMDDTFDVVTTNKTFKVRNAWHFSGTPANTTATVLGGSPALVATALNGAAVRQPYMKLSIAKVA